MIEAIRKYPRTHHIEGSRLQPGDDDLKSIKVASLRGEHLVLEEKLDGANAALSFAPSGDLLLQSRGHYLTGGYRERHFNLFKTWASTHQPALWQRFGSRHIVYGEWLYAKHTVYYDRLPHYFMEFDIFDRQAEEFLDTDRRHELLSDSPLTSVPVLARGAFSERSEIEALVRKSLYKSDDWSKVLVDTAREAGVSPDRVLAETDRAEESEGIYIKVERDGRVTDRLKFVRQSFLTSVTDSGSHWIDRPIVANQLAPDIDIFSVAEALT